MRHSLCLGTVALVAAGWLVSGCRTVRTANVPEGRPPAPEKVSKLDAAWTEPLAVSPAVQAHAHYATAVIHELNNEADAALDQFYQAALKDPANEPLQLEVSLRLLQRKQSDRALELLQAAVRQPNASGAAYARLGFVYAQQGRGKEAIAANRMAVKKTPRSLAGYRNLFFNYLQTQQGPEALAILDEAARQTGADAGYLINLAELYASYALEFPSQRDEVNPRTLAVLERAEKLKPAESQLRLRLADGFYAAGAPERAAQHYLGALDDLAEAPQVRDAVRTRLTSIFLRSNDRNRAVEQLEAIVRDDPSNAQAYYFLGAIAYDERRWADMIGYLRKTLLFRPQFEQAYYDLASAELASGQTDAAAATLAEARKRFAQNFPLEYLSGLAQARLQNYTNAVKHFTTAEVIAQATDTNRLTSGFYFEVGAAYERKGDRAQAESCFERGLKLRPDSAQTYYDLAGLQIELGMAAEALEILRHAESKFERSFETAYLMGAAEGRRKNYAAAVNHLVAAEAIARTADTNRLSYALYFELGAMSERKGDHAQAAVYFEQCLALKPDFSEALNYLGYMWAERGENLERARELIARALAIQPKNAAYLDSMAWVLYKLDQPQAALEHQLQAVALAAEPDATLYDHLGDIYAALGEKEKAREAWRKSLTVEKSDAVQKKLDGTNDE